MTEDVPASQRWRGRPVHSLLLQAFVFAIPVIASVAAAAAVSAIGPEPHGPVAFVSWWAMLTLVAFVVLVSVDRLARRLLPLATLLKLSMLFPDRAPSRFRVARNAASVRKLQEQLAEARTRGLTAEPVWAAETVLTLITALGHHDRRSRGHSERVHVYAELLADELDIDEFDRDRLRWAALLHDVGKLVVPADLLNKPDAPDDEEWDALRTHPTAGAELCAPLLPWLGEWGLAIAQHHEWYDGTGYPLGLSGLDISRAARIVAVADCYEVMTTSRTYKRAMNPAAAREELAACAGTQFDPAIVRAFLNISLGRLRLAMGPLALLSTVPSVARLTALVEPLARAGAVMGGAAVLVGGGTVLPGSAALPADSAQATVIDTAAADESAAAEDLAQHSNSAGVWSSSNPPPPAVTVTDQEGRRRTAPAEDVAAGATSTRTRRDGRGEVTQTTTDRPSQRAAPGEAGPVAPSPRENPAGDTTETATTVRRPGGANPVPPTSPPGKAANQRPPANPTPPRSPRAQGRDW
jgi:putative nucleotidyltransferase with HDIG domain